MYKESSKIASRGLLLILFFGIFVSGFFNAYQLLLILLILSGFFFFFFKSLCPLQVNKPEIRSIVLFIFAIFVTCLFSKDKISSVKYLFLWISILLIVQIILYNRAYRNKIYKLFVFFCFIECFFILLQRIAPSVVNRINSVLLSGYIDEIKSYFDLHNACVGIAVNQPNAMFFSFCIFCAGIIRTLKKVNIINVGMIALGVICMLLAGKRSIIVIVALALLYMGITVYSKKKKISFKWKLLFLLICGVGIYVLFFTRVGIDIILKNETLIAAGDISNGRFALILEMIDIFKEHPIVGIGPLATYSYTGTYLGHNIYAQALAEMGLLGFCGLIYMVVSNLRFKTRAIRNGKCEDIDYFCVYIQLFFIIYGFFGNPLFSYMFLIPYILFSVL